MYSQPFLPNHKSHSLPTPKKVISKDGENRPGDRKIEGWKG
ncbi:MAG TPA: hypothetical protein VL021_06745 [Brumimicrobium sp.]|nr:hypothetical protein [Brumimicrobium sp.]